MSGIRRLRRYSREYRRRVSRESESSDDMFGGSSAVRPLGKAKKERAPELEQQTIVDRGVSKKVKAPALRGLGGSSDGEDEVRRGRVDSGRPFVGSRVIGKQHERENNAGGGKKVIGLGDDRKSTGVKKVNAVKRFGGVVNDGRLNKKHVHALRGFDGSSDDDKPSKKKGGHDLKRLSGLRDDDRPRKRR